MVTPARYNELTQIPADLKTAGTNLYQTVKSSLASMCAAVTFAQLECINEEVEKLDRSRSILPVLFNRTLKIVNPSAEYGELDWSYKGGLLSSAVAKFTRDHIDLGLHGQPSRLKIIAPVPFLAIAKVVDLALGFLGAALALLTAGNFTSLNKFAYCHLRALDVVTVPFAVLYAIVDPVSYRGQHLLYQRT